MVRGRDRLGGGPGQRVFSAADRGNVAASRGSGPGRTGGELPVPRARGSATPPRARAPRASAEAYTRHSGGRTRPYTGTDDCGQYSVGAALLARLQPPPRRKENNKKKYLFYFKYPKLEIAINAVIAISSLAS